tara:strand:- start:1354 stop:2445 length:1092 start_codon:yes stop_codon:yes gene_type:complete
MKKGQGEGSYRLRKDGRHEWRIHIEGVRKTFYGKSKTEAQQKAEEHKLKVASGLDVSKNSNIGELTNKFLDIKKNIVAAKTYKSYEHLTREILKSLKNVKLADLSTDRCQSLANSQLSKGISPYLIRKTNAMLVRILNYAIKLNYISRNAAEHVELPKYIKKDKNPFSAAELNDFLSSAKNDEHFALWHLLAHTGMRVGEGLALQWSDLNFENGELTISKSFDDEFGVGDTKSRKERRIILSEETLEILKTHQAAQLEKLLNKPDYWENNDLVFASSTGSHLLRRNINKRNFRKISGVEGRTIHSLRHTFASLSLAAGVDVVSVANYLGHSNPNTTLSEYAQYMPSDAVNPSAVLSDLMKEAK